MHNGRIGGFKGKIEADRTDLRFHTDSQNSIRSYSLRHSFLGGAAGIQQHEQ